MSQGALGDRASDVRTRAARVATTADTLHAMDDDRLVSSLARAAAALADRDDEAGRQARALLPESTGLHRTMVKWALEQQVAIATEPHLRALLDGLAPPRLGAALARARLAAMVLAGNVFTASFAGIVLPLLARVPVVAKASSRDDLFPRLFQGALRAVDPDLGASVEVLTFAGGQRALEDALFSQADVVAAYGSDATLAEIRTRLPATTTFVPHGHGLGAVYVPASALTDPAGLDDLVRRVGLDVAAFDQRGCLSPHAVWVERGSTVSPKDFARRLSEQGLAHWAAELPRGPLPTATGGIQLQWRGVAATRGELFEGDGWAVSYEDEGPLRLSPGYRNVSVFACDGPDDLFARLTALGMHLKALGVAASREERQHLAERLPAPLAPRVSDVGEMQTPPLDSLADGHSPWSGLVRWSQVD